LPIDYFAWHAEQRILLNESNWTEQKYLIMHCYQHDSRCGGLSDRLTAIPFVLLMAARTKRLFMIRWSRPCKLEEFLVPNENGVDWSVPEWLEAGLDSRGTKRSASRTSPMRIVEEIGGDTNIVAQTKIQNFFGGSMQYDELVGNSNGTVPIRDSYDTIFHDLFRIMFQPSPYVAKLVTDKMDGSGLSPGEYSVAQFRAFYAVENKKHERSEQYLIERAINAVNCASSLRPGMPVYFASDSKFAIDEVKKYAWKKNHSIVTFDSQEALHLDKGNGNGTSQHPSAYYSVFVDLYLMGTGRCVTYGDGGFGKLAALVSYNSTCTRRHSYKTTIHKCEWTDSPGRL
jgi:hypothetical protein